MPIDLVERTDIVTGGNSAIYGSDAVAGVVNFVLKRNFEGFRSAASSASPRATTVTPSTSASYPARTSPTAVATSRSRREWAKQDTLYFTDRDEQTGAFSGRHQFNATENTGANVNPSAGPCMAPSLRPATAFRTRPSSRASSTTPFRKADYSPRPARPQRRPANPLRPSRLAALRPARACQTRPAPMRLRSSATPMSSCRMAR